MPAILSLSRPTAATRPLRRCPARPLACRAPRRGCLSCPSWQSPPWSLLSPCWSPDRCPLPPQQEPLNAIHWFLIGSKTSVRMVRPAFFSDSSIVAFKRAVKVVSKDLSVAAVSSFRGLITVPAVSSIAFKKESEPISD